MLRFLSLLILFSLLPSLLPAHEGEEAVIQRLTSQMAAEPGNGALLLRRAAVQLEAGDWRQCLADLERAERLGQGGAELLRARALLVGSLPTHALSCLAEAPGSAEVLWVRSQALLAINRQTEAAEVAVKALQLTPKPEPDDWLSVMRMLVEAGQTEKALRLLEQAPPIPAVMQAGLDLAEKTAGSARGLYLLDTWGARHPLPDLLLSRKASLLAKNGRLEDSLRIWKDLGTRTTHPTVRQQSAQAIAALKSIRQQP